MDEKNLNKFQQTIRYSFSKIDLLKTALTHRSSLNEAGIKESNERLEFLGDAVLELIITDFLFHERQSDPEGVLTAARSAIVKTDSLAAVARAIDLGAHLKMSKGEAMTGGRENNAILENATEALIGAIYKDGGLASAKEFIENFILPQARAILAKNQLKDPKSLLQEKVQSRGLVSPNYKVVRESGPDHDKTFKVAVAVDNRVIGHGEGKSKQEAEQGAAQEALDRLSEEI